MKRKKLSMRGSRKLFTKTAKYVKPINFKAEPARGGFRL